MIDISPFTPEVIRPFLSNSILGNTVEGYIAGLIVFFILLILFAIFQKIVLYKLNQLAKKTKTDIDDTFIKIVRSLRPPFYLFLAFYISLKLLTLNTFANSILTAIIIIWLVYQAVTAIQILIDYVVRKKMGKEASGHADAAVNFLSLTSKILLWSVGLLFLLSNLGVNVTSLIAALGVGGIAVAFALQRILEDLFSSFAIYFDKPFVPGDFIVVGDKMGVVQHVGIKTTRLRALQGEEIVFPNSGLTSSKIQNFKKMTTRRVAFKVGVTYDTPQDKLENIPKIIKEIIDSVAGARFDRSHFNEFSDSSLNIETVYYAETGDYNTYSDINQKIHLAVKKALDKDGIGFAFPTQTIHITKE